MFEDVGQKRSLIVLLSLLDPHMLKQSIFTDHELHIKNLALEKYTDREKSISCCSIIGTVSSTYFKVV